MAGRPQHRLLDGPGTDPRLQHRHDGLASLLFQSPHSQDPTPSHSEGLLLRLLKNPPNVAVSQTGGRSSDVCDEKRQHMERTPIGGQGLFSGAGLTADNTHSKIEHGELFDTKENWYPNLEFPEDEVFHVEESEFKFPPDPPNFTQENSIVTKGPWWKELLASPVKRLRLSHIGSGWRPIIYRNWNFHLLKNPPSWSARRRQRSAERTCPRESQQTRSRNPASVPL